MCGVRLWSWPGHLCSHGQKLFKPRDLHVQLSFYCLLHLALKPWSHIFQSYYFVIGVKTSHWVYTFLMAGTLCLCLFSSHALNWCINMMTNLASNRKSTGKWKIDNWQCWEFILQDGQKKIKPDTQIPAGACRQSQGGSALPSLSSKPEI